MSGLFFPLSAVGAARQFEVREPEPIRYEVSQPAMREANLCCRLPDGREQLTGRLVAVGVMPGVNLREFLRQHNLQVDFFIGETAAAVETPSAWDALELAERLSRLPEVRFAYPEKFRPLHRAGGYAAAPRDPLYYDLWHLENRATNGASLGPDLNVRAAWPLAKGAGIIVGISDGGIDLAHRDLTNQQAAGLHFNFDTRQSNGAPASASDVHGTWVAGFVAAQAGNARGVAGVAPQAQFASWVVVTANGNFVSELRLAEMFQYRIHRVAVQNHSWNASADLTQTRLSEAERLALDAALNTGRNGRGVIMARPTGNTRINLRNACDDGYLNDPRLITVGAVRVDGRRASYSCVGACMLLAMPGGDGSYGRNLTSTDLSGAAGWSTDATGWPENDASDYARGLLAGTSFSSPQAAGLAALVLSANTNLTIRDVQQVLVLSARQYDLADPSLKTNGAGLRVSLNTGFGVPDAGHAAQLAQTWSNRPTATKLSFIQTNNVAIPENPLRLVVVDSGGQTQLFSFAAEPNRLGPRADRLSAALPLMHLADPQEISGTNLSGQALLLPITHTNYETVISAAAVAGAGLVLFYPTNGAAPSALTVSDYCPLPAAMIAQSNGLALRDYLATNNALSAQLVLTPATVTFSVTNGLVCEWAGLRVKTTHPRRGDLRVTLQSPAGTVSELQFRNNDTSAGPSDWTYYTCHHHFESGAGEWRAQISDEVAGFTGAVTHAELWLQGVSITDTNRNGLDDGWALARLGTNNGNPLADPDADGYNNAVEQILGTDPLTSNWALRLDISSFNEHYLRLSWPGSTNWIFTVRGAEAVAQPFAEILTVSGRFPETEYFFPRTNAAQFIETIGERSDQ